MSYQWVHLEIAYSLLKHFEWVHHPGDFLLGAIAPDAVHFHEKYHVNLKENVREHSFKIMLSSIALF